jgi:hypothetical protein
VNFPFRLLEKSGRLDVETLEKVSKLRENQELEINIGGSDFVFRNKGYLRTSLKVPYFKAKGRLEPEEKNLREVMNLADRALEILKKINFFEDLIKAETDSFLGKQQEIELEINLHKIPETLGDFYSRAEHGLKGEREELGA